MKLTLKLAAIYNILWGAWVVLVPNHFFELVGMEPLNHPMVWQGMGMVIGVYGLGYWWASFDPMRHWPIVAVGFLGKIFGYVLWHSLSITLIPYLSGFFTILSLILVGSKIIISILSSSFNGIISCSKF